MLYEMRNKNNYTTDQDTTRHTRTRTVLHRGNKRTTRQNETTAFAKKKKQRQLTSAHASAAPFRPLLKIQRLTSGEPESCVDKSAEALRRALLDRVLDDGGGQVEAVARGGRAEICGGRDAAAPLEGAAVDRYLVRGEGVGGEGGGGGEGRGEGRSGDMVLSSVAETSPGGLITPAAPATCRQGTRGRCWRCGRRRGWCRRCRRCRRRRRRCRPRGCRSAAGSAAGRMAARAGRMAASAAAESRPARFHGVSRAGSAADAHASSRLLQSEVRMRGA